MQKLLEAAQAVVDCKGKTMLVMGKSQVKLDALEDQLARFRCTCGEIPVYSDGAIVFLRCCDHIWSDWTEFLDWKGGLELPEVVK